MLRRSRIAGTSIPWCGQKSRRAAITARHRSALTVARLSRGDTERSVRAHGRRALTLLPISMLPLLSSWLARRLSVPPSPSVRRQHLEHVGAFQSPASCQHRQRDTQASAGDASSRSMLCSLLCSPMTSVLSISFMRPHVVSPTPSWGHSATRSPSSCDAPSRWQAVAPSYAHSVGLRHAIMH
jgi:hypothetical protein